MNRTQGVRGSNPLRSTERQANIAFALVVLGIVAVGALTIWLFYGAQF